MNSVVISGKVSFEPKTYATQNGKPYSAFSVAIEEERQGKVYSTYVNVSAFGDLGSKCAGMTKGQTVLVSGKLSSTKKNDQWTLSVMANQIEVVGERVEIPEWKPPADMIKDEDVPF